MNKKSRQKQELGFEGEPENEGLKWRSFSRRWSNKPGVHAAIRTDVLLKLRVLRLALSGAIAGAAVFGLFAPQGGLGVDAVGASAGFVAVLLIRAAHLI